LPHPGGAPTSVNAPSRWASSAAVRRGRSTVGAGSGGTDERTAKALLTLASPSRRIGSGNGADWCVRLRAHARRAGVRTPPGPAAPG
jgi:hypothetical protein